jgi:hypothetical protein
MGGGKGEESSRFQPRVTRLGGVDGQLGRGGVGAGAEQPGAERAVAGRAARACAQSATRGGRRGRVGPACKWEAAVGLGRGGWAQWAGLAAVMVRFRFVFLFLFYFKIYF